MASWHDNRLKLEQKGYQHWWYQKSEVSFICLALGRMTTLRFPHDTHSRTTDWDIPNIGTFPLLFQCCRHRHRSRTGCNFRFARLYHDESRVRRDRQQTLGCHGPRSVDCCHKQPSRMTCSKGASHRWQSLGCSNYKPIPPTQREPNTSGAPADTWMDLPSGLAGCISHRYPNRIACNATLLY